MGRRPMARVVLGAAALIVLGAGIAAPWPYEYRAGLVAGAALVLVYLAQVPRRR